MSIPRSKGPKVPQSQKPLKKSAISRGLTNEIVTQWGSVIPRKQREAIWPLVLSSVSSCLSGEMAPGLDDAIQKIASTNDLKGLIDLRAQLGSPQKYGDWRSYFTSQVVLNLFAKTEQPIKGLDPLAKAVERFEEAERLCRITNRRLKHYRQFDHHARPLTQRLRVHEVFHLARGKIANWLGPLSVEKVLEGSRHGPGGVVGLKRPATTPYFKLANSAMSCSTGAYWYAVRYIASCDAWIWALAVSEGLLATKDYDVSCIPYETRIRLADRCITITDYNEVTFVNKDATTKRSISIETELGVFLQLGVGDFLKGCLRRAGCDLSDQTRNQVLAYLGSMAEDHHDPVTLDARMASDTNAIELVRELFPREWYEFLDNLRSRYGSYRGKTFEWAKFSSMGNGFTFELESMIFLALAQACSDLHGETDWFSDTFGPAFKYAYVSVFGDDIIVPQCVSAHLVAILRYCGFRMNSEKSFTSGPFRESCGKDFWSGVDVRAFYFKRDLSNMRDLIHLHNGLKSVDRKLGGVLADSLELVRRLLPPSLETHLRGAEPTLGDAYIWVEPDEVHRSKLVCWDVNWQRWVTPVCRQATATGWGSIHWKYVQFLYANTGTRVLEEGYRRIGSDVNPFPMTTNPLDLHYHSGGSRGDVTLSGGGAPRLAWV